MDDPLGTPCQVRFEGSQLSIQIVGNVADKKALGKEHFDKSCRQATHHHHANSDDDIPIVA